MFDAEPKQDLGACWDPPIRSFNWSREGHTDWPLSFGLGNLDSGLGQENLVILRT